MLEATLYWHWLERHLADWGIRVLVAHPYQVKLIWQARTKTDPIDARKLAELARVNLLPAIWIPDPATRALRQLRGRVFLVRQRTVMRNRIHAYLTAENLRCPVLDLYSKAGQAWLAAVELPAVVRGQVELVLANHALLTTQIQALDRHIKATVRRDATAAGPLCARRFATGVRASPMMSRCSLKRTTLGKREIALSRPVPDHGMSLQDRTWP
ncbi:MAG: transposase [Gemmatimonadota bacterium]|nr:transposase [Gemmatimonadota bacterium]